MDVREGTTTSADGTKIRYFVAGRGRRTWISTPAMGAPFIAMSRLYEHLADDLTIVTWDMRGFYGSAAPSREDALHVTDHVADLVAVRSAVGVGRHFCGGWSMGVPISLEYARTHAADIDGLLLVSGPHEHALAPIVPFAFAEQAVLATLDRARRLARPLNAISRAVGGSRRIGRAMRALGVVAANEDFFQEIVAEFRHVDWGRYIHVARRLHEYRAEHLAELTMPALVVAAERDRMLPLASAERLAAALPRAELFVVPKATHYLVAEFPEMIAARIERFCARVPERQ